MQARSVGRKKTVGLIPVQSTAKARRLYKMRGRRLALQGRPRLGSRLASQLVLGDGEDDEGGILRHKLPSGKQSKKNGARHNLCSAVLANKRSSKK